MAPRSFRLLPVAAVAASGAPEPEGFVELRYASLALSDPSPVCSFAAATKAWLGCSLPILG